MNKQQAQLSYDIIKRHCKSIKNMSTYDGIRRARSKAFDDINCMAKHFNMSSAMKVFLLRKIYSACVEVGAMSSEYCWAFGNKRSRRYN